MLQVGGQNHKYVSTKKETVCNIIMRKKNDTVSRNIRRQKEVHENIIEGKVKGNNAQDRPKKQHIYQSLIDLWSNTCAN